jgi:GNAT superfamily N-acetyltransferase
MDLALRDAVGGDLPALQEVFRRSSLSNEHEREILLRHPEALEFSGSSLAVGRVRVATVESGTIIGFVTSRYVEHGLELEDLFVDPAWFRRGVGRALIDDVMVFAKAEGITRVEVIGHPHALAFYEEVGFVVDSDVRTEFGFGYRLHLDVRP